VTIRLLFTRHGETEENHKGIICGQQPGTLTKVGKEQAKKIGAQLHKDKKVFDHIYVSDLGRTVATFDNIKSQAQHLDKFKTTLTPLLREKSGGVLEGRPLATWKQEADKAKLPLREFKCAKAESWSDVNNRCFAFLKLLVD
jgi:broad specificity phosphatase PhoE